jgi:hypothetical protein
MVLSERSESKGVVSRRGFCISFSLPFDSTKALAHDYASPSYTCSRVFRLHSANGVEHTLYRSHSGARWAH